MIFFLLQFYQQKMVCTKIDIYLWGFRIRNFFPLFWLLFVYFPSAFWEQFKSICEKENIK